MSNVLLYINGVDRTQYLKRPLSVSLGGDGIVGSTTLHLDQQAGGLDLRPMMDVRLWIPFNTSTNAGVAAKGRLFGGRISKRQTRNIATTKLWDLPCWDYNIILKKSYRRAASVYAVNLSAANLNTQIAQLFGILQGASPNIQLDVVNGVALAMAMPAVSYPGGHTWEWYLQQLLRTAHINNPTVFPSYYMGLGATSGGLDTFGPPVLWVYDAASPPASVVEFSDSPTGSQKNVYEYLTRDTDATAITQIKQAIWNGQVVTATDSASQANYPNPYEDFSGGFGFWSDGEVINDTTSASVGEAQAAVDQVVLAKGSPKDSLKWPTYERVLPGDYVTLTWALEGIVTTKFRVAQATFDWEEPNVVKTVLTLNTRRMGLFDNGTEGFYAPPIEGDHVPPLPASSFSVTNNEYNYLTTKAEETFAIGNTGASPDTLGYIIRGTVGSELINQNVGLNLTPTLSFSPNKAYSFRVYAYDYSNNYSEAFPAEGSPAITGTTAAPAHPLYPNGSMEQTTEGDVTLARYHTRINVAGGTSVLSTSAGEGGKALKLSTAGGATDLGGVRCDFFLARTLSTRKDWIRLLAKTSNVDTPLKYALRFYDSAQALIGIPTTGSITLTTAYTQKTILVPNVATAQYMRIDWYNDKVSAARDVYIDAIVYGLQTPTDGLDDTSVTPAKTYYTTDISNPVTDRDINGVPRRLHYYSSGADLQVDTADPGSSNTGVQVRDATGVMTQQAGLWTYSGNAEVVGSLALGLLAPYKATKTATFTADTSASIYYCNNASGITANLPAAAGCSGRIYTFKRINAGQVTIDGNSSETIDGVTTFVMRYLRQTISIQSDGSNWMIIGESKGTPFGDSYSDYADTEYTITNDPTSDTTIKRNDGSTALGFTIVLEAAKTVRFTFFGRFNKDSASGGRTRCTLYGGSGGATIIAPIGGRAAYNSVQVVDADQEVKFIVLLSLAAGSHIITVKHQATYTTAQIKWWERGIYAEVLNP